METLKNVLSISFKTRDDSYSDQFNRIFMCKLFIMSSIIMSVDYFSDKVNCMIPDNAQHSSDFFHSACWINGFYIFDEMRTRLDKSGYYGIPQRVDYDGINYITNQLCLTKNLYGESSDCIPMTRIYYLHYQWMPVYMISLGMFFYLPYIIFRVVNTDIITLKEEIEEKSTESAHIVKNYFNYSINPISQLRIRIWWNIIVKLVYILFALLAFHITDRLLMGRYLTYGKDYLDWYSQNNTLRHILVAKSQRANAGNVLLPSMGYCDIQEASLESRVTFHNENRFICEISPHILYQYVLMVLWFFFIASIIVSILGLCIYIGQQVCHWLPLARNTSKQRLFRFLTLREIEYLNVVKRKNMVLYGELLRKLRDQRLTLPGKDNEYEMSDELDKYITSFTL